MSRFTVLVVGVSFLLTACDDPKDPQTWIKKLRDPEHATKAVESCTSSAIPWPSSRCAICSRTSRARRSSRRSSTWSKRTQEQAIHPTLICALDFTEDKYHNATLAAKALADLKAIEAVEPLGKVLERPMAIKSRANLAKLAAIKALAELGDKQAVPT